MHGYVLNIHKFTSEKERKKERRERERKREKERERESEKPFTYMAIPAIYFRLRHHVGGGVLLKCDGVSGCERGQGR